MRWLRWPDFVSGRCIRWRRGALRVRKERLTATY
jgi:hypothetical protein